MQPMGRRPVRFPGKIDHHPPKGSVNWWEAELSTESKKTERANGKKEIAKAMTESDDALRVAREEIKRQAAEIEYLKARLEVSAYHPYDGIVSRDATIKLQDEYIAKLREQEPINSAALRAAEQAAAEGRTESVIAIYRAIREAQIDLPPPSSAPSSGLDFP